MRPAPAPRMRPELAAGAPLAQAVARYPTLEAPAVSNVSMRHMRSMATRANRSAGRDSVLRDYLATA